MNAVNRFIEGSMTVYDEKEGGMDVAMRAKPIEKHTFSKWIEGPKGTKVRVVDGAYLQREGDSLDDIIPCFLSEVKDCDCGWDLSPGSFIMVAPNSTNCVRCGGDVKDLVRLAKEAKGRQEYAEDEGYDTRI